MVVEQFGRGAVDVEVAFPDEDGDFGVDGVFLDAAAGSVTLILRAVGSLSPASRRRLSLLSPSRLRLTRSHRREHRVAQKTSRRLHPASR